MKHIGKLAVTALLCGCFASPGALFAKDPIEFWLQAADQTIPTKSPMGQEHWSTILSLRMLARTLSPAEWGKAPYLLNVYGNVNFQMRDSTGATVMSDYICPASLMPTSEDIIPVLPGITEQLDFITYLDGHTLIIEDRTGGGFHFALRRPGKFTIEATYFYEEEDFNAALQEVEREVYKSGYASRKISSGIYRGPAKCVMSFEIHSFPREKIGLEP